MQLKSKSPRQADITFPDRERRAKVDVEVPEEVCEQGVACAEIGQIDLASLLLKQHLLTLRKEDHGRQPLLLGFRFSSALDHAMCLYTDRD